MRLPLLTTALLCLALTRPAPAQTTKINIVDSARGGVVTTGTGKALVFNNYKDSGFNFSLSFPKVEVTATERAGLYTVNGMSFQVLAVPVEPFRTDSVATTLRTYMSSEVDYFTRELGLTITPFARIGIDKSGRECAVWGFPMPEGTNEQVEQQLFLVFISGDYLVNLGSVQLRGQPISEPLELLLTTARTFQTSPTPIQLKKGR